MGQRTLSSSRMTENASQWCLKMAWIEQNILLIQSPFRGCQVDLIDLRECYEHCDVAFRDKCCQTSNKRLHSQPRITVYIHSSSISSVITSTIENGTRPQQSWESTVLDTEWCSLWQSISLQFPSIETKRLQSRRYLMSMTFEYKAKTAWNHHTDEPPAGSFSKHSTLTLGGNHTASNELSTAYYDELNPRFICRCNYRTKLQAASMAAKTHNRNPRGKWWHGIRHSSHDLHELESDRPELLNIHLQTQIHKVFHTALTHPRGMDVMQVQGFVNNMSVSCHQRGDVRMLLVSHRKQEAGSF